jgi:hypothetical protein
MQRLKFPEQKGRSPISRKLRNRNDAHLRLISPIEFDEVSDFEIEYFIVLEDLDCQVYMKKVIVPTEPYDFVKNFPPCLKGEKGFSGIRHDQGKTTGKVDTYVFDYALDQPAIPPV